MQIQNLDPSQCDINKIGISYGSGGQRGIIHLGVIKAFIELGVKPSNIVGASAGSIAATIHAFNPDNQDLMNLSIQVLKKLRPSAFGFSFIQILGKVISQNFHLQSIGSMDGFEKIAATNLPFKNIEDAKIPLGIVATNRLNGQEAWFESGAATEAMLASSSVPGIFPPKQIGTEIYVDGGFTDGLPMFHLAQKGCGTIFAVNLGYSGNTRKPPENLVENLLGSIDILGYQATRYEGELIKALYPKLKVVEVKPEAGFDIAPGDLTKPEIVEKVIQAAYEKSKEIISQNI